MNLVNWVGKGDRQIADKKIESVEWNEMDEGRKQRQDTLSLQWWMDLNLLRATTIHYPSKVQSRTIITMNEFLEPTATFIIWNKTFSSSKSSVNVHVHLS